MGHPRFSGEEIARRGKELYADKIRPLVETEGNIGKACIIDIETGDYEIDADGLAADSRLFAKHPGAALWGERIGYKAYASFGYVDARNINK